MWINNTKNHAMQWADLEGDEHYNSVIGKFRDPDKLKPRERNSIKKIDSYDEYKM